MIREKICLLLLATFVVLFGAIKLSNSAQAKGNPSDAIERISFLAEFNPEVSVQQHAEPEEIILSDEVLSDSDTMSEAEIQAFLEAHDSFLADYVVPAADYYDWEGSTYYEGTMIGPKGSEVDVTGWPASRVISSAAKWYDINPEVILTTLQKESSLITEDPSHHGIVQWCMGFAYTESGIEGACVSEANPSGSCAGFAMQVDWASARYKDWMRWANEASPDALQYVTGQTIEIDGLQVTLRSGAEAALYRYTPHVQTSFTTIYNQWF